MFSFLRDQLDQHCYRFPFFANQFTFTALAEPDRGILYHRLSMSSCSILRARDSPGNQISLLNEDLAPKVGRWPASQEPLFTTDHLRLPRTLEPPISPELRRRQVLLAKHPREQDRKCKLRPCCLDDWSFNRRRKERILSRGKAFRLSPIFQRRISQN